MDLSTYAHYSDPASYALWVTKGNWRPHDWQRKTSEILAEVLWRGDGRLILNAPPRHGKSEIATLFTAAWWLDLHPDQWIAIVSYGSELAEHFGRAGRDIFTGSLVETRLRDDSKSVRRWQTKQGGGVMALGVSGALSGRGFGLILIDDPVKNWEQAYSPTYQRKLEHWFASTLYTRLEPGGSIILSMTRWSDDDLAGYLIDRHKDKWTSLRLPAVALSGDPIGRKLGEPLCPERYGSRNLDRIKQAVGIAWSPMYQQNPTPAGAGGCYTNFGPWNVDDAAQIDPEQPVAIAVDFNSNPGMHALIGQYHEASDMMVVRRVLHSPRMPIMLPEGMPGYSLQDAIREAFDELDLWRTPRIDLYGDATGSSVAPGHSDSAWELVYKVLDGLGLWDRTRDCVPSRNPPPRDRVNAVQETLRGSDGIPHLIMHPTDCQILSTDLKYVRWDSNGKEPDKRNAALTHATDALGYWVEYIRPVRVDAKMVGDARFSVSI